MTGDTAILEFDECESKRRHQATRSRLRMWREMPAREALALGRRHLATLMRRMGKRVL